MFQRSSEIHSCIRSSRSLNHSFTNSFFIHPFVHSFIHSLARSFTNSFIHSLKYIAVTLIRLLRLYITSLSTNFKHLVCSIFFLLYQELLKYELFQSITMGKFLDLCGLGRMYAHCHITCRSIAKDVKTLTKSSSWKCTFMTLYFQLL